MKVKELAAVVDQAAHLAEGDRRRLFARLSKIIAKLPQNETVNKALKKPV